MYYKIRINCSGTRDGGVSAGFFSPVHFMIFRRIVFVHEKVPPLFLKIRSKLAADRADTLDMPRDRANIGVFQVSLAGKTWGVVCFFLQILEWLNGCLFWRFGFEQLLTGHDFSQNTDDISMNGGIQHEESSRSFP